MQLEYTMFAPLCGVWGPRFIKSDSLVSRPVFTSIRTVLICCLNNTNFFERTDWYSEWPCCRILRFFVIFCINCHFVWHDVSSLSSLFNLCSTFPGSSEIALLISFICLFVNSLAFCHFPYNLLVTNIWGDHSLIDRARARFKLDSVRWATVVVSNCRGEQLSWWATVVVSNCRG